MAKPSTRRLPRNLVNPKSALGDLEQALARLSQLLPPTGRQRDRLDDCWRAWLDVVIYARDIEAEQIERWANEYADQHDHDERAPLEQR